ncbi:uncharacterized protein [Ranitomeya imitator]|uniref:uncharacterized protein isoform X2 n=1 Tax=Ranitomeya imitator TaxID=111125 RepID=UPI0037E8C6CC
MRAGRVTFLLGLALIHISLADTSTDEEPTELEDEVVYKAGSVFDGDEIFARFADPVIKYSAEIMKYCNTRECRYFTYCTKLAFDDICIDIRLTNSTHFKKDLQDLETLESRPAVLDRYQYNKNLIFAENLHSLLMYSMLLMEKCTTEDCQYCTYCTKVGYNIVCLQITFGNAIESLAEVLDITKNPLVYKNGYIFDEDEIFAKKSEPLLNYVTEEMRKCTTENCRSYMFCRTMDHDSICLDVFFVKGDKEMMTYPISFPGVYNNPNNYPEIDEEYFIKKLKDETKKMLEGDERLTQSTEDEEEENKEDLS